MQKNDTVNVPASIPIPSADLITYRFDHLDAQMAKLDQKLDMIANTYMPRAEVEDRLKIIEVRQDKLKETDDLQQGSIEAARRITGIGLTILGLVLTCLFIYVSWKAGGGK